MIFKRIHLTFLLTTYIVSTIAMSVGLVICADNHEKASENHSHAHFEHFDAENQDQEEHHGGLDRDILEDHILSSANNNIKFVSLEISRFTYNSIDLAPIEQTPLTARLRFKQERQPFFRNKALQHLQTIVIRT